ncbi:MAG: carboxypeptidase-like regulatory domain-containing protein [Bacteroidota bacterium]
MKNYRFLFPVLLLLIGFSACKKDAFEETITEVETETPVQKTGSVAFLLVEPDDNVLDGVDIKIYEETTLVGEGKTDMDGKLEVDLGILANPSSTIYLLAAKEDYNDKAERLEVDDIRDTEHKITMAPMSANALGMNTQLRGLLSNQTVQLSGRIETQNGDPLINTFAFCFDQAALNNDSSAFTAILLPDADGNYEFLAPANVPLFFTVLAFDVCSQRLLVSYADQDLDLGDGLWAENIGPFDMDAQLELTTVDALGFVTKTIEGTAVDCDGQPLEGVTVEVSTTASGSQTSIQVVTNANGEYTADLSICDPVGPTTIDVSFLNKVMYGNGTASNVLALGQDRLTMDAITGCKDTTTSDVVFFQAETALGDSLVSTTFKVTEFQPEQQIILTTDANVPNALEMTLVYDANTLTWTGTAFSFDPEGDGTALFGLPLGTTFNAIPFDNGQIFILSLQNVPIEYLSGPNSGSSDILNGNVLIGL